MRLVIQSDSGDTLLTVTPVQKAFKLSATDAALGYTKGSQGFYASAKAEDGGKRYQVQFQAVEVGSKSADTPAKTAAANAKAAAARKAKQG